MAAAGCATLGMGPKQEGGGGGTAVGDSAAAAGDSVARADTTPPDSAAAGRPAVADSGRTLRDSVLAVMRARREAGDTAAAREAGQKPAGGGEAKPAAAPGPTGPVRVTDVDSLQALGPAFTPYDVPPALQTEGLEGLLRATILPVIRRHDLPPDEWARFWVLVDRKGRVVDHVMHLTSGHAAFDTAAAAAAEQLRYRPAVRDDEFVPVWVLVRISLLMG